MGEVVNLNRVRKERARAERRKPGSRHVKAGLTKSERDGVAGDAARSRTALDGKRLEHEPETPETPETR